MGQNGWCRASARVGLPKIIISYARGIQVRIRNMHGADIAPNRTLSDQWLWQCMR